MDGRTKSKYRAAHVDTIAIPESHRANGAENAAARRRRNVICRISVDVPNAQVAFVRFGALARHPKTSDKDETIRDFRIRRFDVTNFDKLHVFVFRRANLLRDVHGRTRMMHYVRSLRRGVISSVQKNFWNLTTIHREITKQSTTRRRSATMLVNVVASITSTPRRC